jgi:2-polyprenyl-3-methyl-5-hydroxy-6-metoxy-1,4-benzoquinol methylase
MGKTRRDDITFLYIERPLAKPSREDTLLRELSKETFCGNASLEIVSSENPSGVTAGMLSKYLGASPVAALSLDDTVYYSQSWLIPLVDAIDAGFELASPVCHGIFGTEMPYYSHLTFNDVAEQMRREHQGQYLQKPFQDPPALLVTRESLARLHPDTPVRDLPQNLKSALVPSSLVHRFGDPYTSRREDILPYIPQDIEKVLDVGCARGLLGEIIKKERGCKVYGIEMSEETAQIARTRLDEVFCVNVEEAPLPFKEDLDVIIFADILEHLIDPWRVLERSREWLKPGGIVFASIPNTAHFSIVLDLLRGRWDYLPYGLLSISHVRFFTRASIENMFIKSGYSIVTIQPQGLPLHLKEQIRAMLDEFIRVEKVSEDIFALSYYVVARKEMI